LSARAMGSARPKSWKEVKSWVLSIIKSRRPAVARSARGLRDTRVFGASVLV